ncbi:hypothetical protein RhiirC2_761922, partial [Rhizophagus irregularis]
MVAERQYKKSQSPILSTTLMESSPASSPYCSPRLENAQTRTPKVNIFTYHYNKSVIFIIHIFRTYFNFYYRDEFEQLLLINNWSYFVKDRHYPEVLPKSKDLRLIVNKVRN